jgi:hypothetical protein
LPEPTAPLHVVAWGFGCSFQAAWLSLREGILEQ